MLPARNRGGRNDRKVASVTSASSQRSFACSAYASSAVAVGESGSSSTARRASASLFVDVPEALEEPGDLVQPLRRGSLSPSDLRATLADLAAGRHTGRGSPEEVTVFKSVGTALEDLAAARLVWQAASTR